MTTETLIDLVRVGTWYDHKGKSFHMFHRFTPNSDVSGGELGNALNFEVSKHTRRINGVGLVYRVVEVAEKDGSLSWRLGGAQYLHRWRNEAQRLHWSAEQELRDAARAADAKHKKAADDHPLQQAIAPLRALYKAQVGRNRSQLLAYIVKELTQ